MSQTLNDPIEAMNSIDAINPMASHLNAVRDLFTGQLSVMDRNDRTYHIKFVADIVACYKPANALETQLAQSIGADYWRLNRVRALEEGIYSLCHANPSGVQWSIPVDEQIATSRTQAFLWKQKDFKFLSQYEMRVQRTLNRNKVELKELQAERRQLDSQPDIRPDTRPDNDGFAFSNQPIAPEPAATEPVVITPAKVRTATTTNANGFGFSKPEATAKDAQSAKPAATTTQGSMPIRLAS